MALAEYGIILVTLLLVGLVWSRQIEAPDGTVSAAGNVADESISSGMRTVEQSLAGSQYLPGPFTLRGDGGRKKEAEIAMPSQQPQLLALATVDKTINRPGTSPTSVVERQRQLQANQQLPTCHDHSHGHGHGHGPSEQQAEHYQQLPQLWHDQHKLSLIELLSNNRLRRMTDPIANEQHEMEPISPGGGHMPPANNTDECPVCCNSDEMPCTLCCALILKIGALALKSAAG